MNRDALAAIAIALLGCSPSKPSAHPDEPSSADAAQLPCVAAGSRMATLGCRTARPDYVDWCVATISAGVPLRPNCVAASASCGEAESCR